MAESSVPGAVGERPRAWIDIELDAIRERSRTGDDNCVLAQADRNTLLEHVTNLTIKLRAGGAVGERARKLIEELRRMRPEDQWSDKFYAALAALWRVVKGTEIPAQGTAPHVVMAGLIEDVAWSGGAVGEREEPLEQARDALLSVLTVCGLEGQDPSNTALAFQMIRDFARPAYDALVEAEKADD